jgi:branched-chain amino acid transport system substrate-binding protein
MDKAAVGAQVVLLIATLGTMVFALVSPGLVRRFWPAVGALVVVTIGWSLLPLNRPQTVNELLTARFWIGSSAAPLPVSNSPPTAVPAPAAGLTSASAAFAPVASTATPMTQEAPPTAAPSTITVGIGLPLEGQDRESADNLRNGALMAIQEINAGGGIAGRIKIAALLQDQTSASSGPVDPGQTGSSTGAFASDQNVLAVVSPQAPSKVLSPIASSTNLTFITPSSTNPDITDPGFASQYRPSGKAIYFRTTSSDAFQGPFMANFAADVLHVRSVYILDDSRPYGEGVAKSFERQATAKGINVLGHAKLDPKQTDYKAQLTQIAALNPGGLYYGGTQQAGQPLAVQAQLLLPNVVKLSDDGMYSLSFPQDAGLAAENWYSTVAAPSPIELPQASDWVARYHAKYNKPPQDDALSAYDSVLVINDAVARLVQDGMPITRESIRDYAQQTNLQTPQGTIAFDMNGELKTQNISVFQVQGGAFKFVAAAPQN